MVQPIVAMFDWAERTRWAYAHNDEPKNAATKRAYGDTGHAPHHDDIG